MFSRDRRRVTHPHDDEVVTKQSMKDECDIHKILAQFKRTGIINHINQNKGEYIDLPEPTDFQEALATVATAESAYASLPSAVREEFGSPEAFLAAFYDSSQEERLRELGLLNPKPPAEPPTPTPS